jgi:hypothetical protein
MIKMSNKNTIDKTKAVQATATEVAENDNSSGGAFSTIGVTTAIAFTICIICWMIFELNPNWDGTGVISIHDAVRDIIVSFGTCFCMSILGYVCFSEKFMTKIPLIGRYVGFVLVGYGIITGWVFDSGWCPPQGFKLFTIICAIAFAISGIMIFISTKIEDKKLQDQLGAYKNK